MLCDAGLVKCEVSYNGHYVSDSVIELTVLSTGARHVMIEPRTLAVPYGHTARLHCFSDDDDDDEISWTWLVNGHPVNGSSQSLL